MVRHGYVGAHETFFLNEYYWNRFFKEKWVWINHQDGIHEVRTNYKPICGFCKQESKMGDKIRTRERDRYFLHVGDDGWCMYWW